MTNPEPTVGERLRSAWPDIMATPLNAPAIWEDEELGVTIAVTGHSRVNPEGTFGRWEIAVVGAAPLIIDAAGDWSWDHLVGAIDGVMQTQTVTREMGLHQLRSLSNRERAAAQAHVVARAARDDQVRRSKADGATTAQIAETASLSVPAVYKILGQR